MTVISVKARLEAGPISIPVPGKTFRRAQDGQAIYYGRASSGEAKGRAVGASSSNIMLFMGEDRNSGDFQFVKQATVVSGALGFGFRRTITEQS